ncbi:MAG: phosphoribosylamine--glycine ligase [Oscillospiraceae bacterium]|nr:phosphoribosylamine--glycine ligase [Oscillospiraceae bacterium]
MKVLVIGGGGREHAIIRKLKQSVLISELYAAPGNGGISCDVKCFPVKATEIEEMTRLAVEKKIDFVVVAPDDPLVMGMVDALETAGIKTFGPDKAAAALEGSKVFSKNLMKKYGIPTAGYETFEDYAAAREYVESLDKFPVAIKADGLALGKGVILPEDHESALRALELIMVKKAFGDSGKSVIVEEFLYGTEISVLAFTDGITVKPMVSAMDHKRALDGNKGLNTGGMGVIAPHPLYTEEVENICMRDIFIPTVDAMRAEGRLFKGCLFFGLILTSGGPKVIEYNCRFGDPEAQAVLSLLKSDLMEIILAVREQRLDGLEIEWYGKSAACVVVASGGYPEKYATGLPIKGIGSDGQLDCDNGESIQIHHAGTKCLNGEFVTAGGRVMGVTAVADTLECALDTAYTGVRQIDFENARYRRDIGRI